MSIPSMISRALQLRAKKCGMSGSRLGSAAATVKGEFDAVVLALAPEDDRGQCQQGGGETADFA
jgi:hypothetical protein